MELFGASERQQKAIAGVMKGARARPGSAYHPYLNYRDVARRQARAARLGGKAKPMAEPQTFFRRVTPNVEPAVQQSRPSSTHLHSHCGRQREQTSLPATELPQPGKKIDNPC